MVGWFRRRKPGECSQCTDQAAGWTTRGSNPPPLGATHFRSASLCGFMQRRTVVPYRRFKTTCRFHLQGSRSRLLDPWRRDRQVVSKRRYGTTVLCCIQPQRGANLIYIAVEGWNHGQLRTCCFETSRRPLDATHGATQSVPWAISLAVKRPGRETDHSSPYSADVRNERSYTSTALYGSWRLEGKRYSLFTC
jgi:hypothetical protein